MEVYPASPTGTLPPAKPRTDRPTSRRVRELIFTRDGTECRACGTEKNLHIDHVVPRSAGGSDDLNNLQVLCGSCNSRKGAKIPEVLA